MTFADNGQEGMKKHQIRGATQAQQAMTLRIAPTTTSYVRKILPLPLAKAKNGDEGFWKEKFHAANRKAQHALMKGASFLFFKGGRGRGIFSLFPMCSL
jgi:hypothetical protein